MAKSSKDLKPADPQLGVGAVSQTMEAFLATADVDSAFGEPIEHEGRQIIPASEVLVGMGFGLGYGAGSEGNTEASDKPLEQGEGGGGGGGGRTLSRPVAVIVADEAGVRVEPVVDITKLGLTALTALGAVAMAASRMMKQSKGSD